MALNDMRTLFWVKGARGVECLAHCLDSGVNIVAVVVQEKPSNWLDRVRSLAEENGLPVLPLDDPNSEASRARLAGYAADVFVLAGYGMILRQPTIDLPGRMVINLHGGKLPEFRGSSPMNWALIQGETEHTVSIIQLDAGVDSGPVLSERTFPIGPDETIVDLHARANKAFPEMLLDTLRKIEDGSLKPVYQDDAMAAYWPMRFPTDGLLLFDTKTAQQSHDMIRALTRPYPCAYTYLDGRKVILVSSRLHDREFHGEPGRIYQVKGEELLVCAKDKALWVCAEFEDSGAPLHSEAERYSRFGTLAGAAEQLLVAKG